MNLPECKKKMPSKLELERGVNLSTEKYLIKIDILAAEVVNSNNYHNPETRYISQEAWKKLVDGGVLSSVLLERDPQKRQEEMMKTIRILSYYDIHLGLTYGIVAALGIVSLQRFAKNEGQREEYLDIVRAGNLIGLAVTERFKSGSAALDMDSFYEVSGKDVGLHFSKHLQGLSGNEGMIVALLNKDAKRKTVGLFFVPQEFIKTQNTEMIGLKGVSYGTNEADVTLNLDKHLLVELPRERLAEFQDIFTKSRMLFVAMTLGHLERMDDEANYYAVERIIEGRPQSEILAVQGILQEIKAHREVTRAIFEKVIKSCDRVGASLLDGDTLPHAMEANIVKTLSADYAISASARRAELMGGSAYYAESALQDYIDIWPFQIFEGSRLLLNNQIAREFLGQTKFDGKVVHPSFLNSSESSFVEYFFQTAPYREMFETDKIIENLDDWTAMMLSQITRDRLKEENKGVIGEIVSRLFALGCLDKAEAEDAKEILNMEIAQLAQYFTSKTRSQGL